MSSAVSSPTKKTWKDLGVRFVSAVVLLLICMAPFYFGGWAWAALAALFGSRMLYEWVRMSDLGAGKLAYGLPILGIIISAIYAVQGYWIYAGILCLITAAVSIFERMRRGKDAGKGLWSGFGVLYILVPCLTIIALRGNEVGFDTFGFKIAIPVVFLSVGGDLFESGLKRKLKVKDTGELMPGHGGLLDRLDSLMAASVGFAILIYLFPSIWTL